MTIVPNVEISIPIEVEQIEDAHFIARMFEQWYAEQLPTLQRDTPGQLGVIGFRRLDDAPEQRDSIRRAS